MSFHTVKTYSVTDHAETLKDLIANKQLRVDNSRGISANEAQDVYAHIGRLVVKEIVEAPAPIKVGGVYKTRDGKFCRIIVTDKKGVFPIIGLADDGDIEIPYTYTSKGTISSNSEHPADLVLPTTRRKIVEFIAATPHKDSCKVGAFCPVTGTFKEWDLGDYPGF